MPHQNKGTLIGRSFTRNGSQSYLTLLARPGNAKYRSSTAANEGNPMTCPYETTIVSPVLEIVQPDHGSQTVYHSLPPPVTHVLISSSISLFKKLKPQSRGEKITLSSSFTSQSPIDLILYPSLPTTSIFSEIKVNKQKQSSLFATST